MTFQRWCDSCGNYLIDFLSHVDADPHPHLMVVGAPRPELSEEQEALERYGLFSIPPHNIGYDLLIRPGPSGCDLETRAEFCYRLRDEPSEQSLRKIRLLMSVKVALSPKESRAMIEIDEFKGSDLSIVLRKEIEPIVVSNESVRFEHSYVDEVSLPSLETGRHRYQVDLVKTIQLDSAGVIVKVRLFNNGDPRQREKNGRYFYGYLLKFQAFEEGRSASLSSCRRNINLIPRKVHTGEQDFLLEFKDHAFKKELIYRLKEGNSPEDFAKTLNSNHERTVLSPVIADALGSRGIGIPKLWGYQEKAIEHLLNLSKRRQEEATIISVRTAGGKTEAFLAPILQHCLENIDVVGTKAIIFYPTKALANDQSNRIHRILYHLNSILKEKENARPITLGLYHGDIEDDRITWVVFKCPIIEGGKECGERLETLDSRRSILRCPRHNVTFDYLLSTRFEIYSNPPDVLVTNPDIINILMMQRPEAHSILGRAVRSCKRCGRTYAPGKRICENDECQAKGSSFVDVKPGCTPMFLVFDEIHLLKGALGINVSYILSRLKTVLSHYDRLAGVDKSARVLVGATATIKSPREFGSCLFNVGKSRITIIPPDVDADDPNSPYLSIRDDKSIHRYHLLMMPFAYHPQDTLTYSMLGLLKFFLECHAAGRTERKIPQVLGFVNSIKDANDLIARTRFRVKSTFSEVEIGGHSTDFDKKQRAKVEKDFNSRKLNVLFATRTLEVGVDFDDINVLAVFGAPFSYNDYLQRIGRAGRKSDALVMTVLKSMIPIDNYYFEHNDELVDQNLRRNNLETVPILRENPKITEKSIVGAGFDYMTSHEEAHRFRDNIREFDRMLFESDNLREAEFTKLLDWVELALEGSAPRSYCTSILREKFAGQIHDICGQEQRATLRSWSVLDEFDKRFFLTSIRVCDPEVDVEIE